MPYALCSMLYAHWPAFHACTIAAVQKTGLVMQWCPLQLPFGFCDCLNLGSIDCLHLSHSSFPCCASDSLVSMYERYSSPPLLPKPSQIFSFCKACVEE